MVALGARRRRAIWALNRAAGRRRTGARSFSDSIFLRSRCVGAAYRQNWRRESSSGADQSLFSNGEFEGVGDRHFCAAAHTQHCAYQSLREATRYIRHNERSVETDTIDFIISVIAERVITRRCESLNVDYCVDE